MGILNLKFSRKDRIIYIGWGLFIVVLMIISISIRRYESRQIDKYRTITEARVIRVYRANKQPMINYEFYINGSRYKNGDVLPNNIISCLTTKHCIGTFVTVEYSWKNPKISRLVDQ